MLASDNSVTKTTLEGALLLSPKKFVDGRGAFHKLYTSALLNSCGIRFDIAEDYLTYSCKGALRGLHCQTDPYSQAKLVTCLKGSIFDAIVDLRESSKTFGKSYSVVLEGKTHQTLYVPRGFAHGCLALEEDTLVTYKADNPYTEKYEAGLLWSDPALAIPWPDAGRVLVSEKDGMLPRLADAVRFK
ncbi:MAG: dTDP-4-dehydrorhamnose 3,5-epimerase [Candidatus Micrarchaeota archaeon]